MVISESWLTNENNHWINRSELNEDCLRFRAAPRIDRRGGSLVLCTKIYKVNEIEKGVTRSFEFAVEHIMLRLVSCPLSSTIFS